MNIESIRYETDRLSEMYDFYANILEFPVVQSDDDSFTVGIGSTEVTFERVPTESHFYHYAIRIPKGQLQNAKEWLEQRTTVLSNDSGLEVVEFTALNSRSIYFFDPCDNLLEFVVRDEIADHEDGAFSPEKIRAVNEVGFPVRNVPEAVDEITAELPIEPLVPSDGPIAPVGSVRGMFIVIQIGERWLMGETPVSPHPFEVQIDRDSDDQLESKTNGRTVRRSAFDVR